MLSFKPSVSETNKYVQTYIYIYRMNIYIYIYVLYIYIYYTYIYIYGDRYMENETCADHLSRRKQWMIQTGLLGCAFFCLRGKDEVCG